jgi:hypothetical protein
MAPSANLEVHRGECRCGRVRVELSTARAPESFQPRTDAESCAFCAAHDGVWISDPEGELRVHGETRTHRFATEQVEFHFCSGCDELVYARFEDRAVVRLALFPTIRDRARPVAAAKIDGESLDEGRVRRRARWTQLR